MEEFRPRPMRDPHNAKTIPRELVERIEGYTKSGPKRSSRGNPHNQLPKQFLQRARRHTQKRRTPEKASTKVPMPLLDRVKTNYLSSSHSHYEDEWFEETNAPSTRHEAARRMELWKKSKLTHLHMANEDRTSDEMTDRYHLKMQQCFSDAMNNAKELIQKSNEVAGRRSTSTKFSLSDYW
eukprot:gb/GECG01011720.1/.p1 GENE.gb/GECG01011720.1/~~gb/GECG01011720.1/.p1  ORF type:complete len:181 (+),score=20.80 gb/GECG01011720.1/:1-543(+)